MKEIDYNEICKTAETVADLLNSVEDYEEKRLLALRIIFETILHTSINRYDALAMLHQAGLEYNVAFDEIENEDE